MPLILPKPYATPQTTALLSSTCPSAPTDIRSSFRKRSNTPPGRRSSWPPPETKVSLPQIPDILPAMTTIPPDPPWWQVSCPTAGSRLFQAFQIGIFAPGSGAEYEIAAPGEAISSCTYGAAYKAMSGTSMAAGIRVRMRPPFCAPVTGALATVPGSLPLT